MRSIMDSVLLCCACQGVRRQSEGRFETLVGFSFPLVGFDGFDGMGWDGNRGGLKRFHSTGRDWSTSTAAFDYTISRIRVFVPFVRSSRLLGH